MNANSGAARSYLAYGLFKEGQLDNAAFGRFFQPLEERRKQIEADIPRLQSEVDLAKVNSLSSEEIASEALDLSQRWRSLEPPEKRKLIEAVAERITIGKGEIEISLYYLPSCKEMSKRWRKGEDSNLR